MSATLAAIIGGAAGAVALVGIVIFLVWYFIFHNQTVSRTSETGSSDRSIQGNVSTFVFIRVFRKLKA